MTEWSTPAGGALSVNSMSCPAKRARRVTNAASITAASCPASEPVAVKAGTSMSSIVTGPSYRRPLAPVNDNTMTWVAGGSRPLATASTSLDGVSTTTGSGSDVGVTLLSEFDWTAGPVGVVGTRGIETDGSVGLMLSSPPGIGGTGLS